MAIRSKILSRVDVADFEKLVSETLKDLPLEFKSKIDNVQIVVEDWPSLQIAKGRLLLGLYQGVPKTTWGRSQGLTIPDKITIFRYPILLVSRGNEQLIKNLVADTVVHEIAHHFGISDRRLEEIKDR